MDPRDTLVAQLVSWKSFLDVGGLWGVVGERVSTALQANAHKVAMMDICPPQHHLWSDFFARIQHVPCSQLCCDISDVEYVKNLAWQYEVVHCSGVLYHHPSPMRVLEGLAALKPQHLILTSLMLPKNMQSSLGSSVFVPSLRESDKAALASCYKSILGIQGSFVGIDVPTTFQPNDYTPFWWLLSKDVLISMCTVVGFQLQAVYDHDADGGLVTFHFTMPV